MVRPHRERWIGLRPRAMLYKPAGVPAAGLRVTLIDLDELEAMRLVDGEALQQIEAAERMRISRSSVGRLLESGRAKLVQAILNGEAIEIQEGAAPINYHPPAGTVADALADFKAGKLRSAADANVGSHHGI